MQSTSSLALFHHGVSEVQADFALKMLRTSMGRKINSNYSFVISPSCLSIVLAMAHGGAQGETEREIRKLLANDINAAQLHQYTHQLLQNLLYNKQNNQFFSLELVNKIFIKKDYGVKNEYKLFLDTHFGPNHLDLVEFGAYHNLGTMINSLIEYLTKRKVQNFLRPETIGKFTNFLIVNAIYFKAKWAVNFYTTCVHPLRFYITETLQKDVEMLHSIGTFIYFGTVDFQLLGIPYSGGELFLFILLPRERFGLAQLLAKLTGNLLQNFFCECFETDIYVNMPKFKLETEHYLKEPLKSLGVVQAFGDKAQFGKMTQHTLTNINISQIVQKAVLEVDDEGFTCINAENSRTNYAHKFIADHPFAIFVANRSCDNVLMTGVYRGLNNK
ncbi:hypothetical protein GPALN_013306 [Globodera pallida]|nr:hypothetical protein GPALN_013306 [Globodera pallida]